MKSNPAQQHEKFDWTRRKWRLHLDDDQASGRIVILVLFTLISTATAAAGDFKLAARSAEPAALERVGAPGEGRPPVVVAAGPATTTTATTTTTAAAQSESLKTSLNESLTKFLEATTDQRQRVASAALQNNNSDKSSTSNNNNNNNQQQQQQRQQQQQQQQQQLNKKISCDELSLVLLAQRVLNMSSNSGAISRLVECKQENLLDMNLVEIFGQRAATTTTTGAGSEAKNNSLPVATGGAQKQRDQTVRQMHHQSFINEESEEPLGAPFQHRKQPTELHFGAKLAISLLVAIIALVATATLFDYHYDSEAKRPEAEGKAQRWSRGKRESQAAKLRDYRTLSMSSNCSSNLFCSLNSVASSSAPILGAGDAQVRAPSQNPQQQQQQQHYEANLQLHFNQQSMGGAEGKPHPSEDEHDQNQTATDTHNQRPTSGHSTINMASINECASPIVHATGSRDDEAKSSCRNGSRAGTRDSGSLDVARQVLLAFSLRASARQIFESPPPPSSSETNSKPTDDGPRRTGGQRESVDSLHGLRFLSMIWVIIIHSYNFALRWMFFSNTNTLDGIYKSAASQLIANGSFACDSFFFAGGFLLPYLAYPSPVAAAAAAAASAAPPGPEVETSASQREEPQVGDKAKSSSASDKCCSSSVPGPESGPGSCSTCASPSPRLSPQSIPMRSGACAAGPLGGEPAMNCFPYRCACCCCSGSCLVFASQQQQQAVVRGTQRELHTNEARGGTGFGTSSTCGQQAQLAAALAAVPPPPVNSTLAQQHVLARCSCGGGGGGARNGKLHEQQRLAPAATTMGRGHNNNNNSMARKSALGEKNSKNQQEKENNNFTLKRILANVCHRYARMMPLMMAIIGLCSTLLRYLGEGPLWQESTMMYDEWCRKNWWINAMFLHNFVNRENMCLSHSWYSAVDFQLFLVGQLVLFTLNKSKRLGYLLLFCLLAMSPLLTMLLTLRHHLPAVPLVSSVNEQTMNLYYGEIYIKPYSRASPYLIGILLAYLLRTTSLAQWRLKRWHIYLGWTLALGTFGWILMAMQPAMNGRLPSELESALYSGWSRPLWACATGWMIFACITRRAGPIDKVLSARLFVPLSKLTYPAFLIHPIVMALFYGSRAASFQFSHYLMLYLILGNIVITYASAFVLAALFELPLLSIERALSRRVFAH